MSRGSSDTGKYVVARTDFRRLCRWPNDGIEQERREFRDGTRNTRATGNVTHPDQLALTELLGGWPWQVNFLDLEPDSRRFATVIPFYAQKKAAVESDNEETAKEHLLDSYKSQDAAVLDLLQKIGCSKAVRKASKDASRCPEVKAILIPLLRHNLGSDDNIRHLFGEVAYIRGSLLESGALVAEPPPANSPAGAMFSAFEKTTISPVERQCVVCASKGALGCSACQSVSYCSKECQLKNWPIHKPQCREEQGKPVSERVRVAAAAESAKQRDEAKAESDRQQEEHIRELQASFLALFEEHPSEVNTWSQDCSGKRRRSDLPWSGPYVEEISAKLQNLEVDVELSLGMFPEGIPYEFSGRGVLVSNPATRAKIIVLHERLFRDNGKGTINGHALEGIFVVDRVIQKEGKQKAKWVKVARPPALPQSNRLQRFQSYLSKAKEQAIAVPEDVNLGIHNPPDPVTGIIPTANGDFVVRTL